MAATRLEQQKLVIIILINLSEFESLNQFGKKISSINLLIHLVTFSAGYIVTPVGEQKWYFLFWVNVDSNRLSQWFIADLYKNSYCWFIYWTYFTKRSYKYRQWLFALSENNIFFTLCKNRSIFFAIIAVRCYLYYLMQIVSDICTSVLWYIV